MSNNEKPKSAFAPMRAKLDPAIAAKLPVIPQEEPVAPKAQKTAKSPASVQLESVMIRCELWLEVVNLADKLNAAWGYIERKNRPGTQRIGVVLNAAQWPTNGALARSDTRAVRWLFSVAVLERLSTWLKRPELREARNYIVTAALGAGWEAWQTILWASYALKDHELTSPIETLPIYGPDPQCGPYRIAAFTLAVRPNPQATSQGRPLLPKDPPWPITGSNNI